MSEERPERPADGAGAWPPRQPAAPGDAKPSFPPPAGAGAPLPPASGGGGSAPPPPRGRRGSRLGPALAGLFLIAGGIWIALARRGQDTQPEEPPVTGRAVIVDEKTPLVDPNKMAERDVVVFFGREGAAGLYPERRRIFVTATLTDQAKQVMEELVRGPRRTLGVAVLPPQTALRELYLDQEGTAYVDFSAELAQRHPGGTDAEIDTVYAVVDSLTYNFPEIRSVQILIEGEERETLAGHLDLSRRYRRDMSRVDPDALQSLGEGGPHAQR